MEEAVLEDASKMDDFYGMGDTFHHFWDNYLVDQISSGQDILTKEEDWCNLSCFRNKSPIGVVIRDRLMTDAALGGPKPIKNEHSYSLLTSSPPPSPTTPSNDSNTPGIVSSTVNEDTITNSIHSSEDRHKPSTLIRTRIEDIAECFPVISMNGASCTLSKMELKEEIDIADSQIIKGEPISAPSSPNPASPARNLANENANTIITIQPHSLHFSEEVMQASDSEDEDEEIYQNIDIQDFEMSCIETDGTVNDGSQGLPPTPPSSAGSDSDTSASCSPERRDSQTSTHVQSLKGLLTPRLYVTNTTHTHTTRRPINTPLISCQPKGSTGVLILTEEEKRTLLAEGYPIPTKLPLSKVEEKSLKKIRRKIKNKISAQESRRKKKEYMDNLERRVALLSNENTTYKDRLSTLEDTNRELLKELQRLQLIIKERSS